GGGPRLCERAPRAADAGVPASAAAGDGARPRRGPASGAPGLDGALPRGGLRIALAHPLPLPVLVHAGVAGAPGPGSVGVRGEPRPRPARAAPGRDVPALRRVVQGPVRLFPGAAARAARTPPGP